MWNNRILILFFLTLSFFSGAQENYFQNDTIRTKHYRAGFSLKVALVPQRSLFFPEETINSTFYKEHFSVAGKPSNIDRPTATIQIGGNYAWIIKTRNKKAAFEFGIDLGYQNSGEIDDQIRKNLTNADTSYTEAQITVDYKLHEVYGGGYAIVKSNNNFIEVYIGLGLSVYTSVGSAFVTTYLNEKKMEDYKTAFPNYTNINPYIPIGLEIPLSKKNNNAFIKLMGSIRREVNEDNFQPNRFFLTGGFQFQYQF